MRARVPTLFSSSPPPPPLSSFLFDGSARTIHRFPLNPVRRKVRHGGDVLRGNCVEAYAADTRFVIPRGCGVSRGRKSRVLARASVISRATEDASNEARRILLAGSEIAPRPDELLLPPPLPPSPLPAVRLSACCRALAFAGNTNSKFTDAPTRIVSPPLPSPSSQTMICRRREKYGEVPRMIDEDSPHE